MEQVSSFGNQEIKKRVKNITLPDDRYLLFLKRQRKLILDGMELKCENSDALGNKYTQCSWGACSINKESWPDPEDHIWPDEFVERGRVAPLYRDGKRCPLDTRLGKEYAKDDIEAIQGCFWYCLAFSGKTYPPAKEKVIKLYDKAIGIMEKKTT